MQGSQSPVLHPKFTLPLKFTLRLRMPQSRHGMHTQHVRSGWRGTRVLAGLLQATSQWVLHCYHLHPVQHAFAVLEWAHAFVGILACKSTLTRQQERASHGAYKNKQSVT